MPIANYTPLATKIMSEPLVIVGGGLAGSMVAHYAQLHGWEPIVIDNGNNWAASRASSNLTMPSWLNSLGEVGQEGFKALQEDWPIREILFNSGKIAAYHLAMDDVLWRMSINKTIVKVSNGSVQTSEGEQIEGTIVVAAGIWCSELLNIELKALTGHTLLFRGQWPDPILELWAPYRHLKVFQWLEDIIMFGDSTAILHKNYDADKYEIASLARARRLGLMGSHHTLRGIRPVAPKQPVLCEKLASHLWVLTGGGKMGMTVYAAAAKRLVEEL